MQLTTGANTSIPNDQLELHLQVRQRAGQNATVDVPAYAWTEATQKGRGDQDMIFMVKCGMPQAQLTCNRSTHKTAVFY